MNVTVPNTLSCPMWYKVVEFITPGTNGAQFDSFSRTVTSLTDLYTREDHDPRYSFQVVEVVTDPGDATWQVEIDEEADPYEGYGLNAADVAVDNYRDVEPVGTVTLDEYRKGNVRSHLPASVYKKETQADLSERFRKERVSLEKSERWWAMLTALRATQDASRKDAEELFQVERQRRAHRRWLNIYTSTYMGRTMHRVGPMVMDSDQYGHVYCPICKKFDLRWDSHPDVAATSSLANSKDARISAYYNALKRELQERFTIAVIQHFMAHARMESEPGYSGRKYTPQSQQAVTV